MSVKMACKDTMNQHVRVAAYRGGKVRVVPKGQTEVPDVFGRVNGFCHGSQRCGANKMLLGLSLDIFKELGNIACIRLLLFRGKLMPNRSDKGRELSYPVFFWVIMDAVEEYQIFLRHFFCEFRD